MFYVRSITTSTIQRQSRKNFNRFVLPLYAVFLSVNHLPAQADSLLRVYASAQTAQKKTNALIGLSKFYINTYDSTNAKHYTHTLIDWATSQKDTAALTEAINFLGNIQHQYNDFEGALSYHQRAFALMKVVGNTEKMALFQYNIGNDYLSLRAIGKALQAYIVGIEITKNCDCPKSKLYYSTQLANIYSENMGDHTTALMWGKRALKYTEFDGNGKIQITKDIAAFYLALNQLDSARYFADIAYQKGQNTTEKGQKTDILCVKSEIEAASKQSELALKYALDAQKIGGDLPDKGLKGRIFMALGTAFLLRGDIPQARKALLSAEKYIVEGRTTLYRLPKIYHLLAQTEAFAAPRLAVKYLQKAAIVQDSLNNNVYQNQMALFTLQNEYALKETENRHLKMEADNKQRRIRFLIIPLVITTLSLLFILHLYRKLRTRNTELSRLNALYNQKNNDLTTSNQRMAWFTETLSHDALGYINNVLNYANFGKNSPVPKEITMVLEKIHKNAVSLKKMSLNLILFKKTGEIAHTSTIQLTDVVAEVVEDMGEELTQNPVTLNAQNLPKVYADTEFTKQIFRNLLSNAVKFRRPNAELHITILGIKKDDFVEIQVQDNGIGIETEKLVLVFEEFTKLNKSAEGSGLGLFICRQMVDVMGGKIWAEVRPEGGTIIHFTLPVGKDI